MAWAGGSWQVGDTLWVDERAREAHQCALRPAAAALDPL